ncbi:MAG: D-alanyl-D-alanine carboxypeptidase family protein [Eubacteriales bacterium]
MQKRFFFTTIFTYTLLALCLVPQSVLALDLSTIDAPYAILVDAANDEVLFEQNAYDRAYPASITKVMTGIIVAQAIDDGEITLDDMVTADILAEEGLSIYGSSQGIATGETLSVDDLLHCLLIASANEAGNILAVEIAGSQQGFVDRMNAKSKQLGCIDTHYANTHGLHDEDHYTTAYDIYLTLKEAFTYPILADIMGTSVYETAASNLEEPREFYNTNALLTEWYYRGYTYNPCIGGKTGSTSAAGRCLAAAAVSGSEYLISVVLGSESVTLPDGSVVQKQFKQSRDLLQWGINDFDHRTISSGTDPITQVVVNLSEETDFVMVMAEGSISKTLPVSMDLDEISSDIHLFNTEVDAPVFKGDKMGTITLSYEGEVYGTLDLVAVNDVERSELLYQQQQVMLFFDQWGLTLAFGSVGLCVGIALISLYFRSSRRPSQSQSSRSRQRSRSRTRNQRRNRRY